MRPMLCALALSLTSPVAIADTPPPQVRSGAFVEMIATRGVECGHLKAWQGHALKALALEDRKAWGADLIASLRVETEKLIADTECDAEALTVWIEAAREGFDSEMLPPYLVVYKTLAEMEFPPRVFLATSLRLDPAPVIAAIDAKLEDLAASGRKAEGGKDWPDYIVDTEAAVLEFVDSLEAEGGDQAAAWIAQSALIIEAWYQESDK